MIAQRTPLGRDNRRSEVRVRPGNRPEFKFGEKRRLRRQMRQSPDATLERAFSRRRLPHPFLNRGLVPLDQIFNQSRQEIGMGRKIMQQRPTADFRALLNLQRGRPRRPLFDKEVDRGVENSFSDRTIRLRRCPFSNRGCLPASQNSTPCKPSGEL